MKQISVNPKWALYTGLLLALPSAWFMLISFLKFELGYEYLFDSIAPALERWGVKESLGFNINLLILFGPVIALALNVLSILRIQWSNAADHFSIHFFVKKSWSNMIVIGLAGLVLLTLFLYLVGENCTGCA